MARSAASLEQRRTYSRERYRRLNNPRRVNRKHLIDVPARIGGKQNPEYHRKLYEIQKERRKEQHKAYRKRTPRKRQSSHEWRAMVVSFLRHRDGDGCWLCGLAVDPGKETIDHVKPVAKGGSHSHDNIKLAHRACNFRRSRNWHANG